MRSASGRPLAACLVSGVGLAWGLMSSVTGVPAAAAATAATTTQCEPLSAAASSSSSSSASASPGTQLCVTVQTSQSSITRGHAASYTVQVSAENGPASGVSVTVGAAPQGETATFTGLCPSGNGLSSCTIGSLGTSLSPSSFQMQAQIPVASSATSVTSVTLTATADATTSPAMTTLPAASETVTVNAPAASPSKSPTSTPHTSTPASTPPPLATTTVPAVLPTLPVVSVPATPGVGTSLVSPVNVTSALPVITPAASPAVVPPSSPVADVGTPAAGNFTLQIGMSAATAQLLGLIVLGLVLLLAATKLIGDQLTTRRNQNKGDHARARKSGGTAKKRFRFPHPGQLARLRRWRAVPAAGKTAEAAGKQVEPASKS